MHQIHKKIPLHYIAIGVWILYALLVCFHFFKSWYLWGLDYFFPAFGGIDTVGANGFILWILVSVTKFILSTQVLEKIIVFCSFFIPFVGGIYLVKKSQSVAAMVFAGICMTCNPYFYDRFADGQLGMYLLFCTIPFWLISLFHFFSHDKKTISDYIIPILLGLITTSISMHGAWFLLVSFVVFVIVFWKQSHTWKFLWQSMVLGLGILLTNLYWIIPNIVEPNGAQQRIDNFGANDLVVFQNYVWQANNYITTLSLQWYRWEWYHRFIPSYGVQKHPLLIFLVLFAVILVWVIYKLRDSDKDERKFAWSMLILIIIWYVLWLGIVGENIFAPMLRFLYTHIPFYAAMRESHKWVLLMVLWYSYFGAYGLHALCKMLHRKPFACPITIVFVFTFLIWYTPSLFTISRQIPVIDYPQERYMLREQLLTSPGPKSDCSIDCYDILVLPWHQYMRLSFVWKNVLNPAKMFFNPLRILQWDNIEIGPLYSQSNNSVSNNIIRYLTTMGIVKNNSNISVDDQQPSLFIQYLKTLGVRYIVLLKEVDYSSYQALMMDMLQSQLIQKYEDNWYLVVYQIL